MHSPTAYARLLLAASLLVILAPAQPQSKKLPDSEETTPSIKVDVDVVNILCSVRNKAGGLVGNLSKDDFTLFEDGKPQTIKYFTRETDLPLTIGLLIDISGSQARLIEDERRAAYQFFSQVLRKKDMAFLISFGPECELLQDFTNSPRLLQSALEGLHVESGVGGLHPGPVPTASQIRGTVLFDAVYLGATDRLQKEVGRKAMVLITDGVDTASQLKPSEVSAIASSLDVPVYILVITFSLEDESHDPKPVQGPLADLATWTGGDVLVIRDTASAISARNTDPSLTSSARLFCSTAKTPLSSSDFLPLVNFHEYDRSLFSVI